MSRLTFHSLRAQVRNAKAQPHGAVLMEFAIILPLLLILVFGGVEFARSLRVHTQLIGIAREVTLEGFRSCYSYPLFQACMQDKLDTLSSNTALSLPRTRVIATRWQFNTDDNVCRRIGYAAAGAPLPAPYDTTRIPDTDPEFIRQCQEHGTIIGGEALVQFQPIVPAISAFFGFGGGIYRAVFVI